MRSAGSGTDGKFVWHPRYAGKSFSRVRGDLVEEIGRDQRSYKLAMDGADQAEHESLSIIVELERRWSGYDFDWAEMDPGVLADKILAFEKTCEKQKKELSFADYRASGALVEADKPASDEATRNIPVMMIGAGILLVLLAILIVVIVWG